MIRLMRITRLGILTASKHSALPMLWKWCDARIVCIQQNDTDTWNVYMEFHIETHGTNQIFSAPTEKGKKVLTMTKEYIEREAAIEATKHAWAKMDKEEEQ